MTKRYIIDKADIHDLLAGKELSLAQGRESAFCITISGNMTNGDMIKAIFPDVEVKERNNVYEVYFGIGTAIQFFNHQWWNAPYEAESEDEG